MAMKIRTVSYMIRQGFKGLWRNRMMTFASIGSVASALIILGIVFMIILNINSLAETAKGQFDSIQLYLKDDLDQKKIDEIGKTVNKIDGIESVYYISKAEALQDLKKQWGEHGYLLEGLEVNPLPNSYVLKLKDIKYSEQVVDQVKNVSGLEEVKYYKDIVDKLLRITHFIRMTGMIVIGILIGISMFIISNTIKITVAARYREINIMKYVGATNWFVRWPFLIEGMILGFAGSVIALAVIGYSYKNIFDLITEKMYVMVSAYMIPTPLLVNNLAVIFLVLGTGIGALGSIFSMRKFLKV
ncbi:cell division protein FtsX [Geosporobacter subterraneus DSM 17957]|uniref:Cell division protein FtsX n=2 Tax=Geosporobacter TaxID=390805 RepID=A0A1M6DAX0_9FIRM|nr:cell division protein FtsX [Geosporobacter subterraneus DSM 17957]